MDTATLCVYVCVCVHARGRVCVRACVCACVCVCMSPRASAGFFHLEKEGIESFPSIVIQ